jgi:multiple sugar transport system ATP-binding protein
MNFVTAELVRDGGPAVKFADYKIPLADGMVDAKPGLSGYFGREVILGVRPSDFEDASLADSSWARLSAAASVTEELGSEIHVIFSIDAPPVHHPSISDIAGQDEDDDAAVVLAGGKSMWTARVAARSRVKPGEKLELALDAANLQFFDPVSGLSIGHPEATEDSGAAEPGTATAAASAS